MEAASLTVGAESNIGDARTERQRHLARLKALDREQELWRPIWIALAEHVEPNAIRAMPHKRKQHYLDNPLAINATPLLGLRTLSAGMMSGLTSPARPWFALTTPDPEMASNGPVAEWLDQVRKILLHTFARSNVYDSLAQVYRHLGGWGVAAMIEDEEPPSEEDPVRCYVWPIGSYFLQNDSRNRVRTAYRRARMTVEQLVQEFGPRVSQSIRNMWSNKQYDELRDVIRVIEPNRSADPRRGDYRGMPFQGTWLEEAGEDNGDGVLDKRGFHEWPLMCPRWDPIGEDVYARGPGLMALGDCDTLQLLERRKLQMIDLINEPPMVGPTALRQQRSRLQPGDWIYQDGNGPELRAQPVYTIPPAAVAVAREEIATVENRVKQVFYYDLWLALSQDDRRQPMTAREVAERHEEKLLQLGPVINRIHAELLDNLIERTFAILLRQGKIPPPPEDLAGQPLRVEYISILAEAQKLVGIAAIERFAGFVGNLYAVDKSIIDNVDRRKMLEHYQQASGAPPDLLRDQQVVEQEQAQRAAAAAKNQAVTEQAPAAAQAAKVLSEADLNGDNALNRLLYAQGGGAGVPGALPASGRTVAL